VWFPGKERREKKYVGIKKFGRKAEGSKEKEAAGQQTNTVSNNK